MEGELQQVFGENLRVERFRRQLSQEELADLLGIHRTLVGAIERGERNLTLRTIERLSAQLDLDPLDLLVPLSREVLQAAADGHEVNLRDLRRLKKEGRPKPPLP